MAANVRSECGYKDSHLKEIIVDYGCFNMSAAALNSESPSLPARPGSRESVYNQAQVDVCTEPRPGGRETCLQAW